MIINTSGAIQAIFYNGCDIRLRKPIKVNKNDILIAKDVGFNKVNFFLNGKSILVLDRGVQRRYARKK